MLCELDKTGVYCLVCRSGTYHTLKIKKRHIYGGHICVRKMFYIYNKILEILNMIPPIKNTHFGQYKLLSVNRTHLQNKNTLRL